MPLRGGLGVVVSAWDLGVVVSACRVISLKLGITVTRDQSKNWLGWQGPKVQRFDDGRSWWLGGCSTKLVRKSAHPHKQNRADRSKQVSQPMPTAMAIHLYGSQVWNWIDGTWLPCRADDYQWMAEAMQWIRSHKTLDITGCEFPRNYSVPATTRRSAPWSKSQSAGPRAWRPHSLAPGLPHVPRRCLFFFQKYVPHALLLYCM